MSENIQLHLEVNGQPIELSVDPRVTLLDALREHLTLTGTKKGCDQGQCGACTVHINGKRVRFLEHDAFQCGYCTPGQIMSAAACIAEGHAGSADEIREYMSGNLCRCGAYPNIVDAIQQAAADLSSEAR